MLKKTTTSYLRCTDSDVIPCTRPDPEKMRLQVHKFQAEIDELRSAEAVRPLNKLDSKRLVNLVGLHRRYSLFFAAYDYHANLSATLNLA